MLLVGCGACAGRLTPLTGIAMPARFPEPALRSGHRKIVFRWELDSPGLVARGDGAVRLAPPDSARLDFFLADGNGSGAAVLIGDDLRVPARASGRRLLPPPPLLWAALGRLAVPAERDTVARAIGDTLRADLGNPVAWRVTFVGGRLAGLEHVAGGRVREWVTRSSAGHVRYHDERDRRTLDLVILQSDRVGPFDATLWTFP